jgi:SAM-dependent methyltransferase
VCGARSGEVVYSEACDPLTGDSFQVIACSGCGVAYTSPRPTSADRYYPQRYRAYGPLLTRILGAFYRMRVARWAAWKRDGGSVLEVGCGLGLMLAAFSQHGWRATGIERNAEVIARIHPMPGVEITTRAVEELPLEARFDLIVMFHVLEHIGDPVQLLRGCARRLAPGGRLIVNVPNFGSWQARFAGPKWLHLDVPRHLVHYTPKTLAATFERAGLKASEFRFVSIEHDPYGWVESASNRLTSRLAGRSNTLTRFLMGIDRFGPGVALSMVIGAVLAVPAFVFSCLSWAFGSGAVMEATAISDGKGPRGRTF